MHAFGPIGPRRGRVRLYQHWLRTGGHGDIGRFNINTIAARAGRFMPGDKERPGSPLSEITHAYHLDAGLYARFLRDLSERRGLKRREGRIVETRLRPEDGFIESVLLESGEVIAADFFIDCSGFSALLIGQALGVGFESWAPWLMNDCAYAVPCEPAPRIAPNTRATAHGSGWRWRIPLQHRTGNGIVYASASLSDDAAVANLLANLDGKPLADPRPIRFTPGRRAQAWAKNCVAIGLAAGFLEPLESTSLHMTQTALLRLINLFPDMAFDPNTIAEYNRQSQSEAERIRDFIILHYKATERRDTPYWRAVAAANIPETLQRRLDLFRANGRVFREPADMFAEESWLFVLLGKGVRPQAPDPLALIDPVQVSRAFLDDVESVVARCVAQMPTHEQTLGQLSQIARRPLADPRFSFVPKELTRP